MIYVTYKIQMHDNYVKYNKMLSVPLRLKNKFYKEAVGKKKSLALKMSSHQEKISESSCEDEEDEMAIMTKRYKKLVFQKSQQMGRGNFNKNPFKGGSSRGNEMICNGYKMSGNLKNEYPLNKKAKRYKMKKKILVETWSDCDSSSSDDESMIEARANFSLMEKKDKVCNNDDFVDLDTLQHEYDCLFFDFEKLMSKCKDLKKTITSLNIDLDVAKNEYEIVIGKKKVLEDSYNNAVILKPEP